MNENSAYINYTLADFIYSFILSLIRYGELKNCRIISNNNLNAYQLFELHFSYFFLQRILNEGNYKYIVVANDHTPTIALLIKLASLHKIKTIYLQHAAVSNIFPKLYVDFAFLDGKHSLDCYSNGVSHNLINDSKTSIQLVGSSVNIGKFTRKKSNKVLLAIGLFDSLNEICNILKFCDCNHRDILIRFHPSESNKKILKLRNEIHNLKLKCIIEYSINNDLKTDYVESNGMIIAGDSAVHLQFVLMGGTSIYYKLDQEIKRDYYGFVENALSYPLTPSMLLEEGTLEKAESFKPSESAIEYYCFGFTKSLIPHELVADRLYDLINE